jgi:CRP-like cAMP-binding protein
MSHPQAVPSRNRILASLAPEDAERLRPHLEHVPLRLGEVLIERLEPIDHVYFIEAGISSDTAVTDAGEEMEVGIIGPEGLVGVAAVLDMDSTSNRSFMQAPGMAQRIRVEELRRAMDESPALRRVLHRFVHAFLAQTSQTAGCNGRHVLDQRLARWLLMAQDRLGDDLPLTHEFLSIMLGVRRSGVTIALRALARAGIVEQKRGHIRILDRTRLEALSCLCYRVVKAEFDRVIDPGAGAAAAT